MATLKSEEIKQKLNEMDREFVITQRERRREYDALSLDQKYDRDFVETGLHKKGKRIQYLMELIVFIANLYVLWFMGFLENPVLLYSLMGLGSIFAVLWVYNNPFFQRNAPSHKPIDFEKIKDEELRRIAKQLEASVTDLSNELNNSHFLAGYRSYYKGSLRHKKHDSLILLKLWLLYALDITVMKLGNFIDNRIFFSLTAVLGISGIIWLVKNPFFGFKK